MYKFLAKNGQLLAFGLGALVTVLFLGSVFSGLDAFTNADKEAQYGMTLFNFGLSATIALIIVCGVLALLFGIYQVATNIKGSLKGILGIVAIIAIFFIGQSVAGVDGAAVEKAKDIFDVTPGQSAYISGGIITTLAMIGIAVLAFVVSEVSNFFK
ncbi:MAG: hypothetical protein AB8G22_16600 [Saprospiraceae bacterium]